MRRKRVEEAIRQSEERFRRIFEQGPFAMAMSDQRFRFFKVNPAFCAMFGYSEQELGAITFREITHPDHLGVDIENVERLVRGEISTYQTEKRYVTKSGTVLWGNLTLSILRDSRGDFQYFLVLIENIDERKRAEQAMRDAQRFESLAVLAGGIAHDFNNLLVGIFGHIELARMELPEGSEAAEHLAGALSVSTRARALTQQLLTFTKAGAPKKERLDLPEMLAQVARFALSGSNVAVKVSAPDTLWACEGDETQLSRALENILINARQAMPSGGAVSIEARNVPASEGGTLPLAPGSFVSVEIADRGTGIPEEVRGRIFDPFFTTKTHGNGLGLSIAFSIVKRHGGHIDVRCENGRGSVFTIYLPSCVGNDQPEPYASEPAASGAGLSILLMDDEPIVRGVTAELLRSAGHHVTETEEGEQAVLAYRRELAAGRAFDVVILDLTVPGGMGGGQAIEKLLAIDPSVRAIAASGHAEDPIVAQPAKFGFAGSIRKPYLRAELLRLIDAVHPNPPQP